MLLDEQSVILTRQEFEALLDYSCSLPTGTVIGKRWKCRRDYYDESRGWLMAEYIADATGRPDRVGIRWRDVLEVIEG